MGVSNPCRSLFLVRKKPAVVRFKAKASVGAGGRSKSEDSESCSTSSEEEEYQPLLTKSWTSNKAYYTVNM